MIQTFAVAIFVVVPALVLINPVVQIRRDAVMEVLSAVMLQARVQAVAMIVTVLVIAPTVLIINAMHALAMMIV